MTLDELKEALLVADPAAVLVSSHLLARVIREVHGLRSQAIQVPHRKSCILDRHILFRHVEPDDLDLSPDRLLPTRVILLARPPLDRRNNLEREGTLLTYWRRLFHARVHFHLEQRVAEGGLGPDEIADRVAHIGATEFEEVRAVLQKEQFLFPQAGPRDVYIEFAAVYLELRFFLPDLLPVYFPAIRDRARIDELLARDVDAGELFARTRLADVTGPPVRPDRSADEPTDYCWKLTREARRAARAGNTVRAAILRTRAARIAPAALTLHLRGEVLDDLEQLTARLQAALKLTDEEAREWRKDLPGLLEKTGDEQWSVEARLLYDLQKACVENEREVYALDLVEWALSVGKRPIKRPLTNQRVVRITRHLRSAAARLTFTRLSEADRQHLGALLHDAMRSNEERLRARFRPVLANALHDVGLWAANAPEQAALHKMVEELLDRIADLGFFTFSDVRDAISRNNLKLPDLSDPRELVQGDPLLRLDRLLAPALDGVYRPSEVYLRLIQRVTAVNFGTRLGRLFTRYVTIPVGGALAILEGVDLVVAEVSKLFGGKAEPLYGPLSVLRHELGREEPSTLPLVLAPLCWLLVSVLLFGLLYVAAVRRSFREAGVTAYQAGRLVLVEWPARALPLAALRRFLKSWPFQLLFGLVLKPMAVCAAVWLLFPKAAWAPWPGILLFLTVALLLNWRPVRALEDAGSRGIAHFLEWLRYDVLYGLVRFIVWLFKRMVDGVESLLYTVDEWFRFRSGDSRVSMLLRVLLGVVWFPVSYLLRLYVMVLIEPGINPLKAPISILAAKFVYPLLLSSGVTEALIGPPERSPRYYLAWFVVVGLFLWWLPDAFGFLFWETKENWRLYRANRPPTLRPVMVGPHGETVLQLLKPGFHSGTLPKLYAQWRRAEREAHQGGPWRAARACRDRMQRLEGAVRRFVERDALVLLHLSLGWAKRPVGVGPVVLASNVIRIDLLHADFPGSVLRLAVAQQAGLLLARVEEVGWVRQLPPAELTTLLLAVAGLYKLAGIDLVEEQMRAGLPPGASWEVGERELAVRLTPAGPEEVYDVREEPLLPLRPNGPVIQSFDPDELIFARRPITWRDWVEAWGRDADRADGLPTANLLPAVI
jgi:hypothetical protein